MLRHALMYEAPFADLTRQHCVSLHEPTEWTASAHVSQRNTVSIFSAAASNSVVSCVGRQSWTAVEARKVPQLHQNYVVTQSKPRRRARPGAAAKTPDPELPGARHLHVERRRNVNSRKAKHGRACTWAQSVRKSAYDTLQKYVFLSTTKALRFEHVFFFFGTTERLFCEKCTDPMSQTATSTVTFSFHANHSGDEVNSVLGRKEWQFSLRSMRTVLCDGSDTNLHDDFADREFLSHKSGAEWQMNKSSRNPCQPSKCLLQIPILRIHDTCHKNQPLWDQLVTIIHDENTTHIQLHVIAFLLSQTNREEHGGTQTTTRGAQLDPQRLNASRTRGRLSQRHQQFFSTQSETCC